METVIRVCVECGTRFESYNLYPNQVCYDCEEISVRMKKDGEEYYTNVQRKDAEFLADKYRKEGYRNVHLAPYVNEAF